MSKVKSKLKPLENKVSVSQGNIKMGAIPSISLPPIISCRKNVPCAKCGACYAYKIYKLRPSVHKAYDNNFEILKNNPDLYYATLESQLMTNRFFRLHVSGDFYCEDYFRKVVEIVSKRPECSVLAFTKQYEIVNSFIENGGVIPENFKVIFSNWDEWKVENPFHLPESEVIFKHTDVKDDWKICGGNCTECACKGIGCWELKKGETIAFYKH